MSASATIANLKATAARYVLPLPATFTDAAAGILARYAPPTPARVDLADLVADATARGVDPFEDDAVRTALARSTHAAAVASALASAREAALDLLLREHKAAILEGWSAAWSDAGATLAQAHRDMPGVDFAHPGGVTAAGPTPARLTAWADAHAAVNKLEGIATAVTMLLSPGRPETVCLIGAALTAAQHDELHALDRTRLAWGACTIGVPLDLVTGQDDLDTRAANVREERARIAATKPTMPSYLRA